MWKQILFATLIGTLIVATGCKKDEEAPAEAAATEPKKVEEAAKATKSGALKKGEEPNKRPLIKKTSGAKKAASADKKKEPAAGRVRPSIKPADPSENQPEESKAAATRPQRPTEADGAVPDAPALKRGDRPAGPRTPGDQLARGAPPQRIGQPGPRSRRTSKGPGRAPTGVSSSGRARPNAELLLRRDDIREILKYRLALDVHQLSGSDHADDEYDGIYWGSPNGKKLIAGVQIWRHRSPIEAQRRYSQMLRSFPNAEETDAITKKGFLAYWNDFIYLSFFEIGKQSVVNLTCHRSVCNSPQKLVLLASRIRERL